MPAVPDPTGGFLTGGLIPQRLQRGAAATIQVELLDQHGEITTPTGTVTVGVVRSDGTTLVAAGTATTTDGTARTLVLSAAQTADPDVLRATWTDGTDERAATYHETVGGFYFSVAQARASDTTLQDEARYPADDVRRVRGRVEYEMERGVGFALVPRFARVRLRSRDARLELPHLFLRRVLAVREYTTADSYTTLDVADLDVPANDAGLAVRQDGAAWGTVVISYEHGWDAPAPDLLDASLMLLRARLNAPRSGIPDRAERYQAAEGGTYVLSMPGRYRTGLPDVDAIIDGNERRVSFMGF